MIKQAISGLWTSFLQWGIGLISSAVFYFKKQEAIALCKQYQCWYYVIQSGYFRWTVLRVGAMEEYKKLGIIDRKTTAIDLRKIAAFIAKHEDYPNPYKK